jgi:hypothetical protein
LCLYSNTDCVSSIGITYTADNTIEINSETVSEFQNKKYNTLLRAVIIMISPHIICNSYNIEIITSTAISPISAWLLIKNYDVILGKKFMKYYNDMKDIKDMKDIINTYIDNKGKKWRNSIKIQLILSDANIQKATDIFTLLTSEHVNSILC